MPTMIQQPELQSVQVHGLQAVERPVAGKQGLGSFLSALLPVAGAAIDTYQKENRDQLIAQGMNDQVNGVQRDVSFVDRQNYTQGVAFQKVSSTQAANQQQFTADVQRMVDEGKSEADIYAHGQEFLRKSVDMIRDSDLDPALKESLYETNLKENAQYHKLIAQQMQTVAQQREQFDAQTRMAATTSLLMSGDHTPGEITEILQTHVQKSVLAQRAPNLEITPEKAYETASKELTSMIKYMRGQIDPSDPDAGKWLNKLDAVTDAGVRSGKLPMSTMLEIQKDSNTLRGDIMEHNDNQLTNSIESAKWSVIRGVTLYNDDWVTDQIGLINKSVASGMTSERTGTRLISDLFSFGEQRNKAAMEGTFEPVSIIHNGISLQQFSAAGKGGEATYSEKIAQGYEGVYNGDPVAAGSAMIKHSLTGDSHGEALPGLMRAGSTKLSSQFVNFLTMPKGAGESMPTYGNAVAAYDNLKVQYNKLASERSPLANELLLGIKDDNQRIIIRDMFEANQPLNAAVDVVQNAPQYMTSRTYVDTATKSMKWDDFRNGSFLGIFSYNNADGFVGKRISENMQDDFVAAAREVYNDSTRELTEGMRDSAPRSAILLAKAKGMHVTSPAGYVDALIPARAAQFYGGIQYKGHTMTNDNLGGALDTLRQRVAKQANIDPSQTLALMSGNGEQVIIRPYGKDGLPLIKNNSYSGVVFNKTDLVGLMQDNYDNDVLRGQKGKGVFNTVGLGLGGSTLLSAREYRARNEKYTVDANGTLGRVNVFIGRQPTQLQLSPLAATPFNGNATLAHSWQAYLSDYEGFKSTIGVVKGTGTDRDGLIIGNGVNLYSSPRWKEAFTKAQGNPQAILNLQAQFMSEDMAQQQTYAVKVGIPPATQQPYDRKYLSSQLLLADYKWHNGNYNAITKIMNAATYSEALAMMRKSAAYTHAGEDHRRNIARRNMLREHFIATGKL